MSVDALPRFQRMAGLITIAAMLLVMAALGIAAPVGLNVFKVTRTAKRQILLAVARDRTPVVSVGRALGVYR